MPLEAQPFPPLPALHHWVRVRRLVLLVFPLLGLCMLCPRLRAAEEKTAFDIPIGDARRTLRFFSQQSGVEILYPARQIRGTLTQRVKGRYTPREALALMLATSGLEVVQDGQSGALVIRRSAELPRASTEGSPGRGSNDGVHPMRALQRTQADDDELVVLSAFEVQSSSDLGYRASNSVSATRMAVPISRLPMAVSAFTREFIEDQKPYDLYDVVKWSPGVHQDNVSPQGWVRYNIRGFTSAAVQRNGFGSFRFIDATNVERIEVVKGPASLLYGQINPGGVINYITKRPRETAAVSVTAGVGDRNFSRIELDATGPVPHTGGRVFYRGVAMAESLQRFHGETHGHKLLLAPSATIRLGESSSLFLDYEHFERREEMLTGGVVMAYAGGVPVGPYAGLPWDFNYAGRGDFQDFASDAITAELISTLGEYVTLRATYLDSYWDMEWRATGQGGTGLLAPLFIDYYYPPDAALTPTDAMFRRNRWEHQWGGERSAQVDLTGEFELGPVRLSALAGYRHTFDTRLRHRQKNNPNEAGHPHYLKPWDLRDPATWDRSVPFGLEALRPAADTQSSSDGESLYAVTTAVLPGDRVRLLGGYARHVLRNDPMQNLLEGSATPATTRSAHVPQLGALVELTGGMSAFVSYSESFLANASMLRVNNLPAAPAAPSRGRGLEGGLKLDLLDGRLSGTVSVYEIRASPAGIVTVTSGVDESGTTLFTDVQGGSQRSTGFEVDLLITPIPQFQVITGVSVCDALYVEHPSNPAFDRTPLVATPEWTFSLWGKYRFSSGSLKGLALGGGVSHVGEFVYVGNNPFARNTPYTTVDLSFGYTSPGSHTWEVGVSVKNVANAHYYASGTSWGFARHAVVSLTRRF